MSKGKYNCTNSKSIRHSWENLFSRCYSGRYPSYKNCTVHPEWYNFQNFAKWYTENKIQDWPLDKDILVEENKVYGPYTCCFVPQEINNLFTSDKPKFDGLPRGVSKEDTAFVARGSMNGKKIRLGRFKTVELAHSAWKEDREEKIKRLALKYKSALTETVFNKLINN